MIHRAAKPKEANAAGRRTGPFPMTDRTRATADASNPIRLAAAAKEYFVGPSGRPFAREITNKTESPMTEARVRPRNTAMHRHLSGSKRGFEVHHRRQPQISDGTGKMYPAKPIRVTRIPIRFSPRTELAIADRYNNRRSTLPIYTQFDREILGAYTEVSG
jgi:hypothetical protein